MLMIEFLLQDLAQKTSISNSFPWSRKERLHYHTKMSLSPSWFYNLTFSILVSYTSIIFFASFSPKELHSTIPILGCLLLFMVQLLTLLVPVELILIWTYRMKADRQHFHRIFEMHNWAYDRLPLWFFLESANILGFALWIILSGVSVIL